MTNDTAISICTFTVSGLTLGVDVRCVQEVIRQQRLTRVPRAADSIAGLMNLRGQIVTAIDLRHRLGLPEIAESRPMINVVLRTAEGPVSLLVDRIGDVELVDSSSFEPPPETLRGIAREFIEGVYKLQKELLLIVNANAVLGLAA